MAERRPCGSSLGVVDDQVADLLALDQQIALEAVEEVLVQGSGSICRRVPRRGGCSAGVLTAAPAADCAGASRSSREIVYGCCVAEPGLPAAGSARCAGRPRPRSSAPPVCAGEPLRRAARVGCAGAARCGRAAGAGVRSRPLRRADSPATAARRGERRSRRRSGCRRGTGELRAERLGVGAGTAVGADDRGGRGTGSTSRGPAGRAPEAVPAERLKSPSVRARAPAGSGVARQRIAEGRSRRRGGSARGSRGRGATTGGRRGGPAARDVGWRGAVRPRVGAAVLGPASSDGACRERLSGRAAAALAAGRSVGRAAAYSKVGRSAARAGVARQAVGLLGGRGAVGARDRVCRDAAGGELQVGRSGARGGLSAGAAERRRGPAGAGSVGRARRAAHGGAGGAECRCHPKGSPTGSPSDVARRSIAGGARRRTTGGDIDRGRRGATQCRTFGIARACVGGGGRAAGCLRIAGGLADVDRRACGATHDRAVGSALAAVAGQARGRPAGGTLPGLAGGALGCIAGRARGAAQCRTAGGVGEAVGRAAGSALACIAARGAAGLCRTTGAIGGARGWIAGGVLACKAARRAARCGPPRGRGSSRSGRRRRPGRVTARARGTAQRRTGRRRVGRAGPAVGPPAAPWPVSPGGLAERLTVGRLVANPGRHRCPRADARALRPGRRPGWRSGSSVGPRERSGPRRRRARGAAQRRPARGGWPVSVGLASGSSSDPRCPWPASPAGVAERLSVGPRGGCAAWPASPVGLAERLERRTGGARPSPRPRRRTAAGVWPESRPGSRSGSTVGLLAWPVSAGRRLTVARPAGLRSGSRSDRGGAVTGGRARVDGAASPTGRLAERGSAAGRWRRPGS